MPAEGALALIEADVHHSKSEALKSEAVTTVILAHFGHVAYAPQSDRKSGSQKQ